MTSKRARTVTVDPCGSFAKFSFEFFAYLDIREILNYHVVCRSWQAALSSDALWRRFLLSDSSEDESDKGKSKKQIFHDSPTRRNLSDHVCLLLAPRGLRTLKAISNVVVRVDCVRKILGANRLYGLAISALQLLSND